MTPETPDPKESTAIRPVTLNVPFPDSFVYSNVSSFSLSSMDIRIGFGEAMPDGTAQARVGIVMPPEHAAHVAITLMQQLTLFEATFGPIRHPAWRELLPKEMSEALMRKFGHTGESEISPGTADNEPHSSDPPQPAS